MGVIGLVNLSTIHVECEEIVHRHGCRIIQITHHHGLAVQERLQIAVLHPEQGILRGFTTKIIISQHHRTKSQHLDMERGIGLIVVGTLLQEEFLDFRRRNIAVVNLQLAILLFIKDMIVIEDGFHIHLRLIGENIAAIRGILIDGDIAILSQFEDIGKQIQLFTLRLYGIVKAGIGIFCQIDFAIDVTTPNHLFWHLHSSRERNLSTHRHRRRRVLPFRLLCLGLLLLCLGQLCL